MLACNPQTFLPSSGACTVFHICIPSCLICKGLSLEVFGICVVMFSTRSAVTEDLALQILLLGKQHAYAGVEPDMEKRRLGSVEQQEGAAHWHSQPRS